MSDARTTFIQQLEAELSRIACTLVLDSGDDPAAIRAALGAVAERLAEAPFTGLISMERALAKAAQEAVSAAEAGAVVAAVESALGRWKEGGDATVVLEGPPPAPAAVAAPAAPLQTAAATPAPVAPEPPAEDDELEVLRSDPEIATMFVGEALDHLGTIEATVLQLESAPEDKKLLNDVFRPFHTIKGNAGALGVKSVQEVAHRVESLLDLGRSGKIVVGPADTDVILRAVDLLTTMIKDLDSRVAGKPAVDVRAVRDGLMAAVEALSDPARRPAAVESFASGPVVLVEPLTAAPAPAAVDPLAAPALPARPGAPAAPSADAAAPVKRPSDAEQASVKVDTRKLDNLVDMVGELVIVQSLINADPALRSLVDERLARNLAQFRRITSDLQRNAMSMRMVPIRQTFQKMARIVRDLGKKSGKSVELVLSGEDTELDRKVVEDIHDPLMHMVRNSMDHGIEDAATRTRNGKPPVGRLGLSAYHQGGNIVIEISDDGQGLNAEKLLKKAVEKGLVRPGEQLGNDQIYTLIFKAGFSTAEKVTEISGRGVGMDVVRRNIEALRGKIDIQTEVGKGTTFLIKLPLTLAILDGLLLRVGHHRFVLPTFAVRESLRPAPSQVHSVQGKPRMIQVRDQLMPLVSLAELFGIPAAVPDPSEATVVVIEDDGRHVGVVVDELLGKQEVVIKSLGESFSQVKGIAGGAILGDGRVGLILDANGVLGLMGDGAARAA